MKEIENEGKRKFRYNMLSALHKEMRRGDMARALAYARAYREQSEPIHEFTTKDVPDQVPDDQNQNGRSRANA